MDEPNPLDGYKLLLVPVRQIQALSRGIPQEAVVSGRFEVAADVPEDITPKAIRSAIAAVRLGMSTEAAPAPDWTVNAESGRSNSSTRFQALVTEVARLIRPEGRCLDPGWVHSVAMLIMAQLAHVHGLAPREEPAAGASVWVIETHTGHGENAGVLGACASPEAARKALESLPNMRVYVTGAPDRPEDSYRGLPPGTLVGDPVDEDSYPHVWATVRAMKVLA